MRGKPTSKSRVTGRCRSGKTRCRSCRDHPVKKSRQKRRGRHKRFAADVRINPSLAEFLLHPSLKLQLRDSSLRDLVDRELDERRCAGDHADDNAVQVGIFVATVNSLIEAAFAKMQGGYGDDMAMDEAAAMACTTFELASGRLLAGDGTDISAIEEAFHRELGIFENAVEGSNFSETHFARKWGSVLSEGSWSDIEFLESELECSEEEDDDDDWFMVDGEDDVRIGASQAHNRRPSADRL